MKHQANGCFYRCGDEVARRWTFVEDLSQGLVLDIHISISHVGDVCCLVSFAIALTFDGGITW